MSVSERVYRCYYCEQDSYEHTGPCPHCGGDMRMATWDNEAANYFLNGGITFRAYDGYYLDGDSLPLAGEVEYRGKNRMLYDPLPSEPVVFGGLLGWLLGE